MILDHFLLLWQVVAALLLSDLVEVSSHLHHFHHLRYLLHRCLHAPQAGTPDAQFCQSYYH